MTLDNFIVKKKNSKGIVVSYFVCPKCKTKTWKLFKKKNKIYCYHCKKKKRRDYD